MCLALLSLTQNSREGLTFIQGRWQDTRSHSPLVRPPGGTPVISGGTRGGSETLSSLLRITSWRFEEVETVAEGLYWNCCCNNILTVCPGGTKRWELLRSAKLQRPLRLWLRIWSYWHNTTHSALSMGATQCLRCLHHMIISGAKTWTYSGSGLKSAVIVGLCSADLQLPSNSVLFYFSISFLWCCAHFWFTVMSLCQQTVVNPTLQLNVILSKNSMDIQTLSKYLFCQAQGQTWNVKSKLGPEIGSVMGWSTHHHHHHQITFFSCELLIKVR